MLFLESPLFCAQFTIGHRSTVGESGLDKMLQEVDPLITEGRMITRYGKIECILYSCTLTLSCHISNQYDAVTLNPPSPFSPGVNPFNCQLNC